MKSRKLIITSLIPVLLVSISICPGQTNYTVVDTGQDGYYNNYVELLSAPVPGEPFYGQDANYAGVQPDYNDNNNGTITDLNTGLMWQKTPDFVNLRTWEEAQIYADSLVLAGYDDWRVPTIKELYSIINFNGTNFDKIPYLDTNYFDFEYPDPDSGLRDMDAQYWSSTVYVGTTMNNNPTAFGVNFADGRIKGYSKENDGGGKPFARYVRCVRSGNNYGVNNFIDNGDGTIADTATGLMWMKSDCGYPLNWEQALKYSENQIIAGYNDWRLPNAKELQSIIDYTRAPDAQDPNKRGPAIDPIFDITETESYFWTGTTHLDGPHPDAAVYICFGQAWGYMGNPGHGQWMNVHGAGAQRSDPKITDPAAWHYVYGRGPQGDDVRIFNYVRCVRQGLGNKPGQSPNPGNTAKPVRHGNYN